MDDPLYSVLKKIYEQPNLYLAEKSLEYLFEFIGGYTSRALELDPNYHDCLSGKSSGHGTEFEVFVHSYYYGNALPNTRGWRRMISENNSSEADAFDKFYEIFDEFLQAKVADTDEKCYPLGRDVFETDNQLYGRLKKMREWPRLYFYKNSLMYIYHYIVGYTCRALELDPNYHNCFSGTEFDEFVNSYYYGNETRETKKWITIISDSCNSEEEAFDKFYELFDEFLQTKEDNPEIS